MYTQSVTSSNTTGGSTSIRMNRYSPHWSAVVKVTGTIAYSVEVCNATPAVADTEANWVVVGTAGAAVNQAIQGSAPFSRIRLNQASGSGAATMDFTMGNEGG